MSPKLQPILDYLDALEARVDLPTLGRLLEDAGLTVDDVREHLQFHPEHYCRNRIAHGPWYDLYVMGWRSGQCSRIHDHVGSSCGLRIVQGCATEIVFTPPRAGSSEVRPCSEQSYGVGTQCLAQDGDIHQIVNRSPQEDLVTIHIYSPPLKMNLYQPEPEAVPAGV